MFCVAWCSFSAQRRTIQPEALLRAQPFRSKRGRAYQLQAAIAALHVQAPSAAETDWTQISHLYFALLRVHPSPVVELNAAVALAMAGGMAEAICWMEKIEQRGYLAEYHLLYAARADLHRRQQNFPAAAADYQRALALVRHEGERVYLQRRLQEFNGHADR